MNIKWTAELAHVREVSLLGSADLSYWNERLADEKLRSIEREGRAQLRIMAAEARFMGVHFRELSVSVVVSPQENDSGIQQDAAYLVHAFNSSRLFAFCERVLFSTPYYFAEVMVSSSLPASVRASSKASVMFAAAMRRDSSPMSIRTPRAPSFVGSFSWVGPVFLPAKRGQRRFFFARIGGQTETYPFLPDQDLLRIAPTVDSSAMQALVDSRFAPTEWSIRADASHAKSKTYRREDLSSFRVPG